jgi:hypothetical protein
MASAILPCTVNCGKQMQHNTAVSNIGARRDCMPPRMAMCGTLMVVPAVGVQTAVPGAGGE